MKINIYILPLLLCTLAPLAAQALISFDLTSATISRGNTHTDTVDGLKLDMATNGDWVNNVDLFYTNINGLCVINKDNQTMTFTFDQDVRLEGFNVGQSWALDGGEFLTLNNGSETLTINESATGYHTFSNRMIVTSGSTLTLTSRDPNSGSGGGGVLWKSLSVSIVPEPATYALIIGGLALSGVILRRCFRR